MRTDTTTTTTAIDELIVKAAEAYNRMYGGHMDTLNTLRKEQGAIKDLATIIAEIDAVDPAVLAAPAIITECDCGRDD